MFSLKYSSLLDFEQQTEMERANLRSTYGVKKVCWGAKFWTTIKAVNIF
jgi:hypothetical protein